jgi:hypothetical protein
MIISHLYSLPHYLNEPEVDAEAPAGFVFTGWRCCREGVQLGLAASDPDGLPAFLAWTPQPSLPCRTSLLPYL